MHFSIKLQYTLSAIFYKKLLVLLIFFSVPCSFIAAMDSDNQGGLVQWVQKNPVIAAASAASLGFAAYCCKVKYDTYRADKATSQLLSVVQQGDDQKVHRLLWLGANVDVKSPRNRTPLHIAAEIGSASLVRLLLERGAKHSVCDDTGFTPLHYAAQTGSVEVVDTLLNYSIPQKMDIKECAETSPFMVAVVAAKKDVAELLLEKKCVTYSDFKCGVKKSIDMKNEQLTELLLSKKQFDIKAIFIDGYPLAAYITKFQPDMLQKVIELGARLDDQADNWCDKQMTALHIAATKNDVKSAKLLLAADARADLMDNNGRLAMHCAACNGSNVLELLCNPESIKVKDAYGHTPLYYAITRDNENVIRILLNAGALNNMEESEIASIMSTAIKNAEIRTLDLIGFEDRCIQYVNMHCAALLHEAVSKGTVKHVAWLLEKGVNHSLANNQGDTPLHIAVKLENREKASLLLKYGGDAIRNKKGLTPLHVSVLENNVCLDMLVKNPHVINVADVDGNTPLHTAVMRFKAAHENALECKADHARLCADLLRTKKIYQDMSQAEFHIRVNGHPFFGSYSSGGSLQDLETELKNTQKKIEEIAGFHKSSLATMRVYKNIVSKLIESGARIDQINNRNDTPEKLFPQLINELVYIPFSDAIKIEDMQNVTKFLERGASPNKVCNEDGLTLYNFAVLQNKQKVVQCMLKYGVCLLESFNVTGPVPLNTTMLHMVGATGQKDMVKLLLVSPQTAPVSVLITQLDALYKSQRSMRAFLGCMANKDWHLPFLPGEVQEIVYAHLLPEVSTLVNLVSLPQLPKFIKYCSKNALLNALVARHSALLERALQERDNNNLTPHMAARHLLVIDQMIVMQPPNEISDMLDPQGNFIQKNLAQIRENYAKIL